MKTILIDPDGVLNQYTGNYIEDFIPPPKKETKAFLSDLNQNYKIIIFSTRKEKLINDWLTEHKLSHLVVSVTNKKVPAFLYIDDRCIRFNGDYKNTLEEVKIFKPYWKK